MFPAPSASSAAGTGSGPPLVDRHETGTGSGLVLVGELAVLAGPAPGSTIRFEDGSDSFPALSGMF